MKRLNKNQKLGLAIIAVAFLILLSRGNVAWGLLSLVGLLVYAAVAVLILMFIVRFIRAIWRLGA
jgi:hypothetical protein